MKWMLFLGWISRIPNERIYNNVNILIIGYPTDENFKWNSNFKDYTIPVVIFLYPNNPIAKDFADATHVELFGLFLPYSLPLEWHISWQENRKQDFRYQEISCGKTAFSQEISWFCQNWPKSVSSKKLGIRLYIDVHIFN